MFSHDELTDGSELRVENLAQDTPIMEPTE
jgi:hypothetical protein